ncbi:MAG: RNA-binding protein, partial [Clostridia bacterium]|nr:RNA-binding protein [Clostridia bacterium]
SHRDYLGSILSLGIDRSFVGDVVPQNDHAALIFVSRRIAPFISSELDRVGSDKVTVKEEAPPDGFTAERKTEDVQAVAASLRLDAVLGAVFQVSRSEAKELVLRELCEVNFETEDRPDRTVVCGDVISARGYGKFAVGEEIGVTRSGKIRVTVRKYV